LEVKIGVGRVRVKGVWRAWAEIEREGGGGEKEEDMRREEKEDESRRRQDDQNFQV